MNKIKDEYTLKLKKLEPIVLSKYIQIREKRGILQDNNILSLHSTINTRIYEFAKIKERTYTTADELLDVYCYELRKREDDIILEFINNKQCCEYFEIYIRRYFHRKQKELSKNKPKQEMYEMWFGDNTNCYCLMITPVYRYSYKEKKDIWENDKSEIRKVEFRYWSVAHVLKVGLLDKVKNRRIIFADIEELICFYRKVFYDYSKSKYEKAIMLKYFDLLRCNSDYNNIAFLIPELRFTKEERHKYRLDFTVLSTEDISRNIGFELSPNSTHANSWDKAIGKINEYYEKFNIHVRTFMQNELQDIDSCFKIIQDCLYFKDNNKESWKTFKEKIHSKSD